MATSKRFIAKNGLDNNSNSITNLGTSGSSLELSGANAVTFTTTGTTNVTLPTSGTLATTTALGAYVLKAGDTMTGALTLTGDGQLLRPQASTTSGIPGLRINNSSGTRQIEILSIGSAASTTYGAPAGSAVINTNTNVPLYFSTGDYARMVIDATTGNVGIGTASPSAKLHVVGSQVIVQGASGGFTIWKDATPSKGARMIFNTAAADALQWDLYDGASWSNMMLLSSSGNLGIGTVSPAVKFVVSNGGAAGLEINPNGGVNGGTSAVSYNRATSAYVDATNYALTHRWWVGNAGTSMILDTEGRLGVGTTTVTSKVDVVGGDSDGIQYRTGTRTIGIGQVSSEAAVYWGSGTALTFFSGTERMRITSAGNLGVGISSPTAKLHAYSASGLNAILSQSDGSTGSDVGALVAAAGSFSVQAYIQGSGIGYITSNATSGLNVQTTASSPLVLSTNSSERMRITAAGDILVGTTNTGAAGLGISTISNLTFPEGSGTSYVNLFRQASSAATILANGYKFSNTANGFASSTGASWPKTAIGLGVNTGAISFYADAAAAVANGTDVTPTERMRIAPDGCVSIGTASSAGRFTVTSNSGQPWAVFNNPDNTGYMAFQANGANFGFLGNANQVVTGGPNGLGLVADGNLIFTSGGTTEKARITTGGDVLVGTNAVAGAGGISLTAQSAGFAIITNTNAGASGYVFQSFRRSGTEVGSITQSGTTGVAYNTSSDRRLKDNIAPATDAGSVIDAIEVVQHDWKVGGHVRYGVIAQDLHKVVPEAVSAGDDNEEIEKTWGVDYSKLVPILLKEIQSLRARIDALEKK